MWYPYPAGRGRRSQRDAGAPSTWDGSLPVTRGRRAGGAAYGPGDGSLPRHARRRLVAAPAGGASSHGAVPRPMVTMSMRTTHACALVALAAVPATAGGDPRGVRQRRDRPHVLPYGLQRQQQLPGRDDGGLHLPVRRRRRSEPRLRLHPRVHRGADVRRRPLRPLHLHVRLLLAAPRVRGVRPGAFCVQTPTPPSATPTEGAGSSARTACPPTITKRTRWRVSNSKSSIQSLYRVSIEAEGRAADDLDCREPLGRRAVGPHRRRFFVCVAQIDDAEDAFDHAGSFARRGARPASTIDTPALPHVGVAENRPGSGRRVTRLQRPPEVVGEQCPNIGFMAGHPAGQKVGQPAASAAWYAASASARTPLPCVLASQGAAAVLDRCLAGVGRRRRGRRRARRRRPLRARRGARRRRPPSAAEPPPARP